MKTIIILICLIIPSFAMAHGAPEFPIPGKPIGVFEDSTYFVKVPAVVGGVAVSIPTTIIGGAIGIFGMPWTIEAPIFGGGAGMIVGNVIGQLIVGGPFWGMEEGVKRLYMFYELMYGF